MHPNLERDGNRLRRGSIDLIGLDKHCGNCVGGNFVEIDLRGLRMHMWPWLRSLVGL